MKCVARHPSSCVLLTFALFSFVGCGVTVTDLKELSVQDAAELGGLRAIKVVDRGNFRETTTIAELERKGYRVEHFSQPPDRLDTDYEQANVRQAQIRSDEALLIVDHWIGQDAIFAGPVPEELTGCFGIARVRLYRHGEPGLIYRAYARTRERTLRNDERDADESALEADTEEALRVALDGIPVKR